MLARGPISATSSRQHLQAVQTRTLQGVGSSHGGSRHDSVSCLFVLSYCAGQLHALGDRDTHELVVSEAGTTLRAAGQALERQVR